MNGWRVIDQRVLGGDTRVVMRGDVSIAEHPFRLTRGPRSAALAHLLTSACSHTLTCVRTLTGNSRLEVNRLISVVAWRSC